MEPAAIPKITSDDTIRAAERVIHEILMAKDDTVPINQKRTVAEFVLQFNNEMANRAPGEGVATKDDIERLGRVIGETKEILGSILREGGRAPGLTPIGTREPLLPVQGSA